MTKKLEKQMKRYGLPERATRGELERMFPKALRTKSLLAIVGTDTKDKDFPYFGACYEFTQEYHEKTDWGDDAEMQLLCVTTDRESLEGDAMWSILDEYKYWTSDKW